MHSVELALFILIGVLFAATVIAGTDALRQIRRRRRVEDIATSRIRSAAQGYVELQGSLVAPEGAPRLTPISRQPCLWWRYQVRQFEGEHWRVIDQGQSVGPWLLDDGTGQCRLDPEQAGLLPERPPTAKFAGVVRHAIGPMPGAAVPGPIAALLARLPRWLPRPAPATLLSPSFIEEWIPYGVTAHVQGVFRTQRGEHWLVAPDDGRPFKSHFGAEPVLVRQSWISARAFPWLLAALLATFTLFGWLVWWGR